MDRLEESEALALLRQASQGSIERFKPGQWQAIETVLRGRLPLLLVQATGWGKSLIYFAATLAFRRAGRGPTLLISPLLSLMRDQVLAAQSLGLKAATINSANESEWDAIEAALAADEVDLLLISPERLAAEESLARMIAPLMARLSLFVLDEAHCLSDWGHDFRPDYRRIRRLLSGHLPPDASILATTATASARVIADLEAELGPVVLQKGPLSRDSLCLQVVRLPSLAHRYAWLARRLPEIPGSGIVYATTRRECERLAAFLQERGLNVAAYHAGLTEGDERIRLEEALRTNQIKALVATTALSMGFDKPDLAFVLHHQAPASAVHYYQQIGRAGRALDRAFAVLLGGAEDAELARWFIETAHPKPAEMKAVLDLVEEAATGITTESLVQGLGLGEAKVDAVLKLLAATPEPPLIQSGGVWRPTFAPWHADPGSAERIAERRWGEWERMEAYRATSGCLMQFLARELDDATAAPCGRCANCLGRAILSPRTRAAEVNRARDWLAAHGERWPWRQETPVPPPWLAALKALFRLG